MGLLGKYTTYVGGVATDAHKLLSKLFPASSDYPTMQALQAALTAGKEVDAQNVVKANAIANVDASGVGGLLPANGIQQGDMGMFPTGVRLGYGDSPVIPSVAWSKAGDPASPYIPDIRSPDPSTGQPLNSAPADVDVAQTQAMGTKEDPSGQDLIDPSNASPKVYNSTQIGVPQKLGDSGGNG
jgi:hypothetical protein